MPARSVQWMIAGGFAGWALARLTAVDRCRPIGASTASLLSMTPQVTAGAWLAAAMLRDRRAAAVTGAAAVSLAAVVVPRALPRRQPAATGAPLRVLTVNLLAGRACATSVADLVRQGRADVLFVQELNGDAAARLEAELGLLLPYRVSDLGQPGSRGNAIYARYPLADCPAIATPSVARPAVTLTLPGGLVRLVCVHLHIPRPPWWAQARPGTSRWQAELAELAAGLPRPGDAGAGDSPPVIVAGDFNSTLDHADFRRLLRLGYVDAAAQTGNGLVPTWSRMLGGRALLTIDHVLADQRCAVTGTSVHRIPGTDHRGVFAELRLPR